MTLNVDNIGVPVGGCIPWLSPIEGTPQPATPPGWEYADGGTVVTAGSPLFGVTKPALMATVESSVTTGIVKGANTQVAYGGPIPLIQGGSDLHSHDTSNAGGHSHSYTTNNAAVTINPGGSHSHGGTTGSTSISAPFTDGGGGALVVMTDPHNHTISSENHHSHTAVDHQHNGGTSGVSNHLHTVTQTASLPAYVELAWLIRVL